MLFKLYYQPIEFEIEDEWWATAGMQDFRPTTPTFLTPASTNSLMTIVPLEKIQPPVRNPNTSWFVRERIIHILRRIQAGEEIDPLPAHEPPDQPDFRYSITDGFHRFYASAAAGFRQLPIITYPYFDIVTGHS